MTMLKRSWMEVTRVQIKLKPCPFCGCDMSLRRYTYLSGEQEWQLSGWHSDNCLLNVSFHIPEASNKQKLIRAWNRRANK